MAKTVITGDVFSYNKAVEFIIAHVSKTGIETRLVTKIKLLCQEIILNIIKHAYEGKSGDIAIECKIKDDVFIIEITDYGAPYDSLSQKKLTHKSSVKAITSVSDFGKLMGGGIDSAEYVRVGERNIITLKKSLS